MTVAAHPIAEWVFDLLMFWRAPPGTLRARLYDWSFGPENKLQ